jgi:hypothetical protein
MSAPCFVDGSNFASTEAMDSSEMEAVKCGEFILVVYKAIK